MSPATLASQDRPPYPDVGYGGTFDDLKEQWKGRLSIEWQCCPRWYYQFSRATVSGQSTYPMIRQAHEFYEQGQLDLIVRGPLTEGFIQLLDAFGSLKAWKAQRDAERAQREREQKRRLEEAKRKARGG